MIDAQLTILIHRKLDGELSAREAAELERLLTESPEARGLLDQLQHLDQLRTSLPAVEPPADLKADILRSIDGSLYTTHRQPMTFVGRVRSAFTPQLVYGLAAGLIIGITFGILGARGTNRHDSIAASGTLITGIGDENLRPVMSEAITAEGADGKLTASRGKQTAVIRVDMQNDADVALILDYEPSAWSLRTVNQDPAAGELIEYIPGSIHIITKGQRSHLIVLSAGADARRNVRMRLVTDHTLWAKDIPL